MTKNVIKTMLMLVVGYLLAWYVLKIFFPEWFVLQVNNERLIAIGDFIDNSFILDNLLGLVMSYITYTLYLGALCEIKHLNLKQSLVVCGVYILGIFVQKYDISLSTYYNIIAMIVLPAIFNCNSKRLALVFTAHFLCQWLSLSIRQLSTKVLAYNSLTCLIMTIECYFWLLLWYLWFNYNKIFDKELKTYGN